MTAGLQSAGARLQDAWNHARAYSQNAYKSVPTDETIRAVAWLAGVSDEIAFMVAGQPVPGPPFAEELPPGVDLLPAKARKAAIDMLRVLVDMNKEVVSHGNPAHMKEAGEAPAKGRVLTGTGSVVPHVGLMAARMLVAAEQQIGTHFKLQSEVLEERTANAILQEELSKFSSKVLAEQFQYRVRQELDRMLDASDRAEFAAETNGHPDADKNGHIPLPANFFDLAADRSRNYGAEEEARAGERGEESQETDTERRQIGY